MSRNLKAQFIGPGEDIHYTSWELMKDLAAYLRPYRWRFWLTSLIRLLGDIAWLYPAFAFASLVTILTQYRPGEPLGPVWLLLILWFAAVVVRSLSQYLSKLLGFQIAEKLGVDATLRTVKHLFRLDMAWHEKESAGNKLKRIQNASEGLNRIIRIWFSSIIEIGVNLVLINIIIARFDRTVLFSLLFFLITYFILSIIMTRRAARAAYAVNLEEEKVNGLLFELVNNIRTARLMSIARSLLPVFSEGLERLYASIRRRVFRYQSRNSLLSFWGNTAKIVIIVLIIRGILRGQYEIGFLILFNSYFSDLRNSIEELSTATQDFVSAKLSIWRMKEILNEPIRIDADSRKAPLPEDWREISLENVSFSYGNKNILEDISFILRRGEKIGIVGLSGAGKSTLFKLLLKEREDFGGDIRFDGLSLKQIKRSDYFRQAAVVLQDTEVFNFSIRENITITNPDRARDEKLLRKSLLISHLGDLVAKLPQGLETVIGEKGFKLSGGERQRLGIARAIFKEPELLFLDEATSNLDLESEAQIRDSLHKFFKKVTAIVIAHRLSTIREMDKILVLEGGRILESGTFIELYARRGRFYELWEKQKL